MIGKDTTTPTQRLQGFEGGDISNIVFVGNGGR
jgi:hypothetical protein